MNNVSLIGRLVADPELRHTTSGTAVSNLRVAHRHVGEKERTLFVDVTVWGKLAETVTTHKKKGDQVAISGRLEYSEYNTEEGQKRSKIYIVAENVDFLARKQVGNGKDASAEAQPAVALPEEEILFN